MIDGDISVALGLTKPTRGRHRRASDETVDPLAVHAEGLLRLVKDVADKPKPRDVHHLRTTIRRFETLLPERGDEAPRPERKLQKQLDKLRKRAGKVRDADVHLRALATLKAVPCGDEYEQVRRFLDRARAKHRKRLVSMIADERDRGLLKRVRQVVGHTVADQRSGQAEDALARVMQRFGELWPEVARLGEQDLHEFRVHAKRLRYLAETAAPSKEATVAVAQLKRIQDAAGAWHDWTTLAPRAAKALDTDAPSPLLDAIAKRTQEQLEKAIATTASAGRRLIGLQPLGPRKPARSVPASRPPHARSAGASA